MSEGAKLAGSSSLATPKRRDPNAYTSDKELQKIVIGSSLVKITAQVSAEIFFREKLLSVWMLSEDNKKIRVKAFYPFVMDKSSTEKKIYPLDILHEQCVYGNILRLEKLKAVAVHNPKYHDSPYSYELLFNENSTVRKIGSIFKTQSNISAPSPLADVYKSIKYFADCSPKDKIEIECAMDGGFEKLSTNFILAIRDAKDESAELILKKDTAANVKEFGSDHLIKICSSDVVQNGQLLQFNVNTLDDVTILSAEIPNNFYEDEDVPDMKKIKYESTAVAGGLTESDKSAVSDEDKFESEV